MQEKIIYSMKEACSKTGLSYDTLKFYCNEGLVPNIRRDQNNRRIFDERNIAWIKSLVCLKKCGMSIAEMRAYLGLCLQGEPTIPERQVMLARKLQNLQEEMLELQEMIDFIHWKQGFYQDVLDGKRKYFSNLLPEE